MNLPGHSPTRRGCSCGALRPLADRHPAETQAALRQVWWRAHVERVLDEASVDVPVVGGVL